MDVPNLSEFLRSLELRIVAIERRLGKLDHNEDVRELQDLEALFSDLQKETKDATRNE